MVFYDSRSWFALSLDNKRWESFTLRIRTGIKNMSPKNTKIQLKSDEQKLVCKVGTHSHSRNKSKDKKSTTVSSTQEDNMCPEGNRFSFSLPAAPFRISESWSRQNFSHLGWVLLQSYAWLALVLCQRLYAIWHWFGSAWLMPFGMGWFNMTLFVLQ